MRDDYYDDIEDIEMTDLEDEWLDEEPVEMPARESERASARGAARGSAVRRPGKEPVECRRTHEDHAELDERPVRARSTGRDRRSARQLEDRRAVQQGAAGGSGNVNALNDLLLLAFKIGLVVMFLIFMTTFFFGITQARDVSMEPAVKEGDLVIYYRPDKSYAAGDAIVVDYNGSLQVRRVVATEGDTVDISADGGLIINGATQIEDDIYTTTYPYTDGITFPVTVGSGEVFVLGDDRTTAEDSRMYGTVRISATKGAVMTVIRRRGI